MSDNYNKVFLLGNVGDIKFVACDGGKREFASLSLATSKYWYDNATSERKSKTEWHRVVVYNENLVSILKKKNVAKGSKLFVEGALTNRKWVDQRGNNRVTTEIILQGYNSNLLILPVAPKSGFDGIDHENDFENETKKLSSNSDFSSHTDDDFESFLNDDFEEDDKIPF
jgi:single-strand DNA-binding protein